MHAALRSRRRRSVPAVLAIVGVTLAGCSGEEEAPTPVEAAQAEVAEKEEALDSARAASAEAEAGFCTASEEYIMAIDRYGDVLSDTAPTVGDVREAGADLEAPREEVQQAADEVTAAREAVATAENEYAAAQAALAEASASAAGTTAPVDSATPTPTATVQPPPPSVARVEQAEAEFAAAVEGIGDRTPLTEAGEQFNAAAVALEISWLRLFADSGCLSEAEQQEGAAAVAAYTTGLQQALSDLGYLEGEVDGVYGPQTVAAVEALQEANGLPQTGTVDKATAEALQAELAALGGDAAAQETASTAALQQTLKLAGYWDGPVDGQWSDALTEALQEAQEDLGVEPTGTVDAATVAAFERALTEARDGASETESPTPTTTATTSPEPSPTT